MDADKTKTTFVGCLWWGVLPSTHGFAISGENVLRARHAKSFLAEKKRFFYLRPSVFIRG
jgi:hypothetical protein